AFAQQAGGIWPARGVEGAANAPLAGAGLGAAALSGGASLALLGVAAQQQTGSRRYAAGAVLGRTPLGAVGEIGAALGYLSDEELLPGLHVGRHSRQSDWGAIRRRMAGGAGAIRAAPTRGAATPPRGVPTTAPTPTPAPSLPPPHPRRAGPAARPSHAQPIRSNGGRRARWAMPPRLAVPPPPGATTP